MQIMIRKTPFFVLFLLVPSLLRAGDEYNALGGPLVWPDVVDTSATFHFDDAATASIEFIIHGLDDEDLYCISCHNDHYSDTLIDPDFYFSGEFECRLTALYRWDSFSTLFTEDPHQSADWESRARFFSYEIVGDCANYPDYGRVRNFCLRRMQITLEISDMTFDTSYIRRDSASVQDLDLSSFTFDIRVKSDTTANTGITEPTPYAEPPIVNPGTDNDSTCDCSKVRLR